LTHIMSSETGAPSCIPNGVGRLSFANKELENNIRITIRVFIYFLQTF